MVKKPQPVKMPPMDILRDRAIQGLAENAIADGAVVFGVMYETAGGRFKMATYPASVCVAGGLLVNACEMKERIANQGALKTAENEE
jgi:hypothetical protein